MRTKREKSALDYKLPKILTPQDEMPIEDVRAGFAFMNSDYKVYYVKEVRTFSNIKGDFFKLLLVSESKRRGRQGGLVTEEITFKAGSKLYYYDLDTSLVDTLKVKLKEDTKETPNDVLELKELVLEGNGSGSAIFSDEHREYLKNKKYDDKILTKLRLASLEEGKDKLVSNRKLLIYEGYKVIKFKLKDNVWEVAGEYYEIEYGTGFGDIDFVSQLDINTNKITFKHYA